METQKRHYSAQSAVNAAGNQFQAAVETGSWMAVFFCRVGDVIKLGRTTHNFQIGDFQQSMILLEESLHKEEQSGGGVIPEITLPIAPEFDEPTLSIVQEDKQDDENMEGPIE